MGTAILLSTLAFWAQSETIAGRVTSDGKPVPSAVVFVAQPSGFKAPRLRLTGGDGRFELPVSPAWRRNLTRTNGILATADGRVGFLSPDHRIRPSILRTFVEDVEIALTSGRILNLTVVAPDGEPIADGRAFVTMVIDSEGFTTPKPIPRLTSPLRFGEAQLRVPFADYVAVAVETDQFGTQVFWFQRPALRESHTLSLRKTGAVEGVLRDSKGIPLPPGVRIRVRTRTDGGGYSGLATTSTLDGGRFHVDTIAAGEATVNSEATELATSGHTWPDVIIDAGQTATVDSRARLAATLSGRVIEAKTGSPVAGSQIQMATLLTTGEDGRFKGNSDGTATLVSIPPGFVPPPMKHRYAPEDGGPFIYKLTKAMKCTGVVVDERGEPVSGARVMATWWTDHGGGSTLQGECTRSDENGRFELVHSPGDRDIRVAADTKDRASLEGYVGRKKSLELTVTPAGVVPGIGMLKTADGKPVHGAHIEFIQLCELPSGQFSGNGPFTSHGRRVEAWSDEDGRFKSSRPLVRGAQYRLWIRASDPLALWTSGITIAETGEKHDFGTFELKPGSPY